MQIFTVQDILNALPIVRDTMNSLKDALASAALANVSDSSQILTGGSWIVGGLMLAGSLWMVWRLKGWVLGMLSHLFFRG